MHMHAHLCNILLITPRIANSYLLTLFTHIAINACMCYQYSVCKATAVVSSYCLDRSFLILVSCVVLVRVDDFLSCHAHTLVQCVKSE